MQPFLIFNLFTLLSQSGSQTLLHHSNQQQKWPVKSDVLSFKTPLYLTTTDKAACAPVFILLRKYHPKHHLSCIGCSLTFHFVWQTLIFTSKVLSRRHPAHTYLLCRFFRDRFCRNTDTQTNSHQLLYLKVPRIITKFVQKKHRGASNVRNKLRNRFFCKYFCS